MAVVPFQPGSSPLSAGGPPADLGGAASGLALARDLEQLATLCRTLHERLDRGRWATTRDKLRRQLRRLARSLDTAQRGVLRGDAVVVRAVGFLDGLEARIAFALDGQATKADLKDLRRLCKQARLRLDALSGTAAA